MNTPLSSYLCNGEGRYLALRPGDKCAQIDRFGVGGETGEIRMAFSSRWGGLCTRGWRGGVGARYPAGRTMEVRRVQGKYMQQRGGRESGVKQTCQKRDGVSERTRPVYGLGQTTTVADDLGFKGV